MLVLAGCLFITGCESFKEQIDDAWRITKKTATGSYQVAGETAYGVLDLGRAGVEAGKEMVSGVKNAAGKAQEITGKIKETTEKLNEAAKAVKSAGEALKQFDFNTEIINSSQKSSRDAVDF